MTISLKHKFTSAVADGGDTNLVQPSNWNDDHDLTMATSRLLGRTTAGTGAAEEISVGTGLSLSSGSLDVSTVPIANGGTGQTTAPAASNALVGYLEIVSAAGTTTLDNTSALNIVVTGTANQTIRLPDVTTLQLGWTFMITNTSTGTVTVQSSGANSFTYTLTAGMIGRFICISLTGTTTASWVQLLDGATTRQGTGALIYSVAPAIFQATLYNTRYNVGTITAGTNAQGQGELSSSNEIAFVTSTPNDPSGVTLGAAAIGKRQTVFNLGTNPIVVYPASGAKVNDLATNAGVTIPVGYVLLFEAQTTTQWRTQSLGTSGQTLISAGSDTAPSWGTLGVTGGGTGLTSTTAYSLLAGGTTSTGALQSVSGVGTSGQVLTSNGAGALPTWQDSTGGGTTIGQAYAMAILFG